MTYSQPGIRQTSISTGQGPGSNNSVLSAPTGATSIRNNELRLDTNEPNTILNNAERKVREIDNFFNFFTKTVVPEVNKELDRRASRELGEAVDAFPALLTTSTDDPGQIARLNALSPRAQDQAYEAIAVNSVSNYGDALKGAINSRYSIITAPGADEGTKARAAEALAAARTEAREVSGVGALTPYQQVRFAEDLAKADASAKAQAYQDQGKATSDLIQQSQVQAGGAEIYGVYDTAAKANTFDAGGATMERDLLGVSLQNVVGKINDIAGSNVAPKLLAASIYDAIQREPSDAVRQKMIRDLLLVSETTPLMDATGKFNLWDLPAFTDSRSGALVSLREMLRRKEESMDDVVQKEKNDDLQDKLKVLLGPENRLANGRLTPEAANQARNLAIQNIDAFKTIQQQEQLIGLINSLEKVPAQDQATNDIKIQQRLYGTEGEEPEDPDKILSEVLRQQIIEPGKYSDGLISEIIKIKDGKDNLDFRGESAFTGQQRQIQNYKRTFSDLYKSALGKYRLMTPAGVRAMNTDSRNRSPALALALADVDNQFEVEFFAEYQNQIANGVTDGKEAGDKALKIVLEKQAEKSKAAGQTLQRTTGKAAEQAWQKKAMDAIVKYREQSGKEDGIPFEALSQTTQMTFMTTRNYTNDAAGRVAAKSDFESLDRREQEGYLARSFMSFGGLNSKTKEPMTYNDASNLTGKFLREIRSTQNGPARTRTGGLDEYRRSRRSQGNQSSVPLPERIPASFSSGDTAQYSPQELNSFEVATNYLKSAYQSIMAPQEGESQADRDEEARKWYNSGGLGDYAIAMVGGLLNLTTGAGPVSAEEIENPENVTALKTAWENGNDGLNTPPLPQLTATAAAREIPLSFSSDTSEMFVLIGVAEGTRTAGGGFTRHYYGHRDRGDGNMNRGTVSGGRGNRLTPKQIDTRWRGLLAETAYNYQPIMAKMGLRRGTQGYNRVMFNILDLRVQAPAAVPDFVSNLVGSDMSIESIAKARADAFFDPDTGRLDAPGFNNSYPLLLRDQRSRAGVYDYRRRF